MSKDKPDALSRISEISAEIAAKTTIEVYEKLKSKDRREVSKKRTDSRLRNTKRLIRSYREIKIHAGDAIASLADVSNEDYDFFKDIMEDPYSVDVSAIVRSKARSAIMLAHIDAMLRTFEIICCNSKKPEEQRRYRVIEGLYLKENPLSVKEIAEAEGVDTSTIYKDVDAACEKMSALLFGIQWIERE